MPGNAADAAYEARRKERLRGIMSQMDGEIAAEEAAAAPAPVAEDEDLWSERPERGDVLKKRAETMGVYGALKAINDGGGDPNVSSADVNRAFIKQSGRELQMAGKNIADTVPAIGTSWQKMGSDLNAFYLENPGLIPRVPQEFRAPQEVIEDFILSNEVFRAIPVVGDSFGPASKEEREAKIAESREKSAGLEEKMREQLPEGENAIQQGVVDTTLNLGMMLPSLAASVVTKNPNVGLAMMGTQTGATSYGDARRAGADPTKAYRYGIMMGAVEAATERLPLKYLVGDIGKKTPFLETLKKQLISDGLGEQAATHIQDMLTWVELNPEKTFADYIEERPEAIQRTAITSAMMSLVMTGGQQGISQLGGKDEAPAPESEGGAGEVAEAPTPEAPENSETPPQPQPNEEDQAETSPDPDKLAEVEAISEVIEQAEPAQQPTAREESDAFVAEYEAVLGITPEFEDLAESQPDPGEGGLGRTFESLVEENAEPRPEATSFRDQFGADRPETPIEAKAIDEIEAATPEATSFRSYFGRKSFGGEGLESAPEAANEDVDTTLLSDDEVSAIADNEVLATPEAADAESMLEIAEQNYDEVLTDDILTGLDDQFDMPAEEVREIMDGAIEGQGSTKKFNTLMKRVDKVRRSGVKAARGDKLSDFDKEMNARRRQLHRVALNTFGEWYLELAKSGRVGFASNMQDVLPGVPEDTMAMAMPDGKVVISDRIDPRDFEGLFLHEVGIHAGLQGLIGASGKEAILAEVDRLAETGERFASVARQWARQMAFRPEHAREETLAYLVQFAPAAPIVTRAIASMKVWIARRFPGLIPRLGWKTADFRQLALLSIRNQAYKALEMPVSFRSGLDSDHTTLVLDRPHKSRPPILNPKYRKWPYSQLGEPDPLLLDQTRTTINLEDVGNFRQNVINNEEVLTDPHTLEAMFQAHTDFDVFRYQDLIETVKASDDPDAAYELSAMLEPLKGMDAPLDIQYARGDGFLRPVGFNDDLDRGTDTFFDPRLNEAQNKAVEMARNRFSNAEIAEELEWDGQSVSNALSRARSMGIDVPHGSRGAAGMDRLYMEELIEVGFSNEVIAQRTGKTRNHVKQVRHQVKNGDIKRLPMQTEVRMQRARDLGWNTERQVYHGTPGEIEGDVLRTSPDGLLGRGVYLTTATDQANTYAGEDGGAVLPLFIRGELATLDQLKEAQKRAAAGIGNVMNAQRKIAELAQHYLQQAGYTGVEAGTTIAMFDFSDVRSVNARFDPMRDSQSGFMLSRGGQQDDMFDPYAEKDVYVNLARVAGPEDFKALIQKLANEARPEVKERVGGRRPLAQVEREAANEEAFKALAKRRRGNILNDKEMLALRQLRDSSANKIRELAELYQQSPSLAAKAALHRAMVLHRTIQAEVSGASADAARLLGSLRILSKDSTTRRMAMEDALARWDNDENVDDLVKRIARLGPNQQVELDDLVRVSMKQAWTDLGGAWIRAMFLSNPKTHIVNATGNMAVMAMDVGSTYFGGALTMDQQMISEAGVRASELMDAFYYQMRYMAQHSQMNPTKPNVSLRFDDMGVNGRQVDAGSERALSAGRVSALTGGLASNPSEDSIVGHTINLIGYGIAAPSEALGVADDMFKGINYRVEMRALALRQANAEARDGRIDKDQVSMRIEELLADPSDEMIQTARHAAQERTFTNRPGPLTMGVLRFRRALNNVTGLPLGHLLLPFVITPSNIFSYTFRHLPSAAFFPEWRADYAAGGQRRARAVGQVAMGTSVMMLGMGLASAGIMNGSGPDDIEKKRELQGLAGAGFQPFALNIDGHSYTIDRLDPVSSMLLIGAELNEIWANKGWDSEPDDELGDLLTSSVLNIGRMMLDKSYMTGLRDFVRALEDPYYRERYFARTAAAVTTPALSAEIRRQTDPFWREADTAIASIKNRIPTMSETLPQEYDLFGRPKVYQSGHGVVYDSLMPFIAKKIDPSPIDTELMRLHYLPSTMDRSIGVPVGPQSMQVSLREHPEIYSRMSQLMGGDKDLKIPSVLDRLNELVESDGYAKLMDGPDPLRGSKARAIQDVLADHRERVRQIVVTEYWGDLQQLGREELKRSLARAAEQEEERQSEMAAALADAVAQGE